MNMKGAIFDVDGTLLDSMFIWDSIGSEYLRSRGIEPRPGLDKTFRNMSLYQAACYYRDEYGLKESTDAIMDGVNAMIERYYAGQVLTKDGVPEFLGTLKAHGVRMCVATATDRHLVEAALERTKILSCFDEIFTCTAIGHGKDEAHIFYAAQQFLGTSKKETYVFEDALYAVRTAKQAGFYVVGVYDPFEDGRDEVKRLADSYIMDFYRTEDLLK